MDILLDELNNLKTKKSISIPYEDYFSEMDLTDEEKEKRIEFAIDIEDVMLFILILLSVMRENDYINESYVISILSQRYSDVVLQYIDIDEYIRDYIDTFSNDVVETTLKHLDDEWYFSDDRSILITENEANSIFNYSEFLDAIKSSKTKKQWIDIRDKKERKSHLAVGGKVLPIQEPFVVGGDLMLFPKDETYSPSAEQTANCRCTIKYF